jgi:hypothetical protein
VDEEFQAHVKYIEHHLLVQINMALDAIWKEKKAQKVEKYVEKKNCKIGKPFLLLT